MELAARWIGLFHADCDAGLTGVSFPFLNTYDAEFYLGWARRTSQFAGDLPERFPWLLSLCARFEEIVPSLLEPPLTVIHGEYTPHNVLYRQGIIYPVDWESAAFAVGEIDLAILTDSWSPEVVRQCELEYQRARWPEGSPANFERLFGAARVYTQFRWLGDQLRLGLNKNILGRLEQLRSVGERLGLI
jgi:aminoglycoside phosphotransferase (APT) family kinase protein